MNETTKSEKEKTQRRIAAVVASDFQATLEVAYKGTFNGVEESDSNRFSENFGGISGRSERAAKLQCVLDAQAWFDDMRAQGFDLHGWDTLGNCY